MSQIRILLFYLVAALIFTVTVLAQTEHPNYFSQALPSRLKGNPPPQHTDPSWPMVQPSPPPSTGQPSQAADTTGAITFFTQGRSLAREGRLIEAKEALKTAIRLQPMNPEFWEEYDGIIENLYVMRAREDRVRPVVEMAFSPTYSIQKTDTFYEFGTLYVVGEVKNLSDSLMQNIEVSVVLLDDHGQVIGRETGQLRLTGRGLFPRETSLFEIGFPRPPPGIAGYRVRIDKFD